MVFTLRADRASPRVRSTPMPRVLVVEDDADILAAITEALTEEGWDVVPAPTAIEAMSAAQSAAVDVVLCDVLLDDDTKGTTLRRLFVSQGLGCLPFAFMTASTHEMARLRGEIVLRKPFAISQAADILRAALARRVGPPPPPSTSGLSPITQPRPRSDTPK